MRQKIITDQFVWSAASAVAPLSSCTIRCTPIWQRVGSQNLASRWLSLRKRLPVQPSGRSQPINWIESRLNFFAFRAWPFSKAFLAFFRYSQPSISLRNGKADEIRLSIDPIIVCTA
jgi:hypothetical protein